MSADRREARRPDPDACYRAVLARDARFDGRFVVGSRATGLYCRPSCRTRRPHRRNATFHDTPREAESHGLLQCLRCRPAAAPRATYVPDAVARIDAGALNESSIDDLARALGTSARHLRRQMQAELGISPVELAQSRRLALARKLVEETTLPLTEVAYAAGFRSLRRFNALFASGHKITPSELRRQQRGARPEESFALRLEYSGPLDWDALIAHLAARAVPGVERADELAYTRAVRLGGRHGWVAVYPRRNQSALVAEIALALAPQVMPIVARLRRLFDLDADLVAIERHLARSADLGRSVLERPGLRSPGAFCGLEVAVTAIVGVRAAGRLAARLNEPFDLPYAALTRLPFEAAALAAAPLEGAGAAPPRARALRAVARAVAAGELSLERTADPDRVRARLASLGVERQAIEEIARRALGDPDAHPPGRRVAARLVGVSPWRAYGSLHLGAVKKKGRRP